MSLYMHKHRQTSGTALLSLHSIWTKVETVLHAPVKLAIQTTHDDWPKWCQATFMQCIVLGAHWSNAVYFTASATIWNLATDGAVCLRTIALTRNKSHQRSRQPLSIAEICARSLWDVVAVSKGYVRLSSERANCIFRSRATEIWPKSSPVCQNLFGNRKLPSLKV